MKTKFKTVLTAYAVASLLSIQGIVNADILVNDRSIREENWDAFSGWGQAAGTGSPSPSVSGGEMTMTMAGATEGFTYVLMTQDAPEDYIVTQRLKVTQFSDPVTFNVTTTNPAGHITIADVRGTNRFKAILRPDALYIATDYQSVGGSRWNEFSLATNVDSYYTWQFQVAEDEVAGAGRVEIFRRESDADPFSLVGSSQIRTQDNPDQFYVGQIDYNAANLMTQGSMVSDYIYIGIPEPSTISMILIFSGLMLTSRFIRRRRI